MSMALLEDLFKGNLLTGVVVGLGAVLLVSAAAPRDRENTAVGLGREQSEIMPPTFHSK
jgi:hypothetical protein